MVVLMMDWFRNRWSVRKRIRQIQWEIFCMANEVRDLAAAVAALGDTTARIESGVDTLIAQHAGDSADTLLAIADAPTAVAAVGNRLAAVAEKVDPRTAVPAPAPEPATEPAATA
jgi:hypothetical protein